MGETTYEVSFEQEYSLDVERIYFEMIGEAMAKSVDELIMSCLTQADKQLLADYEDISADMLIKHVCSTPNKTHEDYNRAMRIVNANP